MSSLLLPCSRLRTTSPRVNPRFCRGFSSASPSSGLARTSYIYPPRPLTYISPRPTSSPLANPSLNYTLALEAELQSLPILVSHRSQADASEWYETRPFKGVPEDWRMKHLTAGTLRGPGKLALAPLVRVRKDESESLIITHVGRKLCGHEGIVHGGLLAALLDEGMGRTAINNLPGKIGFTANISVNYRAPTTADQFIVMKTKVTDTQGRKVWVDGLVQDTNGVVLADAKTMWVQPKYSQLMDTKTFNQALGEREPQLEPWAT